MVEKPHRQRTLTEDDRADIADMLRCKMDACLFTQEEVQFVRGWLDTAKTAKSEVVRWVVRMVIVVGGLISGIVVAVKMGWFSSK
jgi:hypothetical protein